MGGKGEISQLLKLAEQRRHTRVTESLHLMGVYNLITVFYQPESLVLDYHQQATLHQHIYSISKFSRVKNKPPGLVFF